MRAAAVRATILVWSALHTLQSGDACPAHTFISGEPNCDEMLLMLNSTSECSHLEQAFDFNCTGCECAVPLAATQNPVATTSGVQTTLFFQNPSKQDQLLGAIWTLVACLVVVVIVVAAVLVHKVAAKDVVVPANEKRPLSEEERAKVRRLKLRMQTRKMNRSVKNILSGPQAAIVQASNDIINAALQQSVSSAFLNYAATKNAASKFIHHHESAVRLKQKGSSTESKVADNAQEVAVSRRSRTPDVENSSSREAKERHSVSPIDRPKGRSPAQAEEQQLGSEKEKNDALATKTPVRHRESESKSPTQAATDSPEDPALIHSRSFAKKKKKKKKKNRSRDERSDTPVDSSSPESPSHRTRNSVGSPESKESTVPENSFQPTVDESGLSLNRIESEHEMKKPPVRRLDSSFFKGSPKVSPDTPPRASSDTKGGK